MTARAAINHPKSAESDMRAKNNQKTPLAVGDRIEMAFGEPGRVVAINGGDVEILLDSGATVTRSVLEVEIMGIAHDLFLNALKESGR